jgi:dimeric dUTPase (all-alpha-NTP-PPase superfamily)
MRQKIISLSLDTYELASKKANFSAWVRRKLMEEQQIVEEKKESRPLYQSLCGPCDKYYQHYQDFMMQNKYCDICHTLTVYLGLIE